MGLAATSLTHRVDCHKDVLLGSYTMFGYLPAPCRCQIGNQADLYRSTFCGLCNALAGQYGQPARLLINRDSTFVALLAAAQSPVAPTVSLSTRCRPWSRPIPVFESGSVPAFAAAVTLCGLQAKLGDEQADERGPRAGGCRVLSALSRKRFDRAQSVLAASDFPVVDIRRQLAEQSRVEKRVVGGGDPAAAAQPTSRAFGSILAHTARLAGNNSNVEPLVETGRNLGKLIYTLDAFQDLPEDCSRGRFNFLAAQKGSRDPSSDESIRELAREIAAECQFNIRQAWQEVELSRYRPVLEAVLLTGLPAKTEHLLATNAGQGMAFDEESPEDDEEGGYGDMDSFPENGGEKACSGFHGNCYDCCYWLDCCDCGNSNGCGECGCDGCCCDGGRGGDCGGSDYSGCDCGGCDCGGGDCSGGDCSGCDCSS